MDIYLVNLARRSDRLAAMRTQVATLGIRLTLIPARDAKDAARPAGPAFVTGPLGEIPRGDQCCTLSHVKAWREFLASGADYAAVLEDDVVLGPGAEFALRDANWIPRGIDLVKLEHYGPARQGVLVSDFIGVRHGLSLARLQSRHTGAAAYILSRRAASLLLAETRMALPVDHLLFNPNNSPLFAALAPRQLLPPVARQKDFVGEKSDIEMSRAKLRRLSWIYVRRELVRLGYELRLLPRQMSLLLRRRAKFVRLDSAGAVSAAAEAWSYAPMPGE
jgi:glycosyl transferase family 25